MNEQWQELKETIIELRYNGGIGTKQDVCKFLVNYMDILEKQIKPQKYEPLSDKEQRIFLSAMAREEKVCKEVCADGDGVDLVAVCHSIERKVKKALCI